MSFTSTCCAVEVKAIIDYTWVVGSAVGSVVGSTDLGRLPGIVQRIFLNPLPFLEIRKVELVAPIFNAFN